MLKYTYSSQDTTFSQEEMNLSGVTYYSTLSRLVFNIPNHGLLSNASLMLNRVNGAVNYREIFTPSIIDDDNFSTYFAKTFTFIVDSLITEKKTDILGGKEKNFVVLNLNNAQHIFATDRGGIEIKEFIYDNYYELKDNNIRRRCVGDYIIYNSDFLYKTVGVEENKYLLNNEYENTTCTIWYYVNDERKEIDVIVPVNSMGRDNVHGLLYECDDDSMEQLLSDNPKVFYCEDNRFFDFIPTENEDIFDIQFHEDASLVKLINEYHFTVPISNILSTDMNNEDLYGVNYVNNEIAAAKNKIVDYEKDVFVPVFITNDKNNPLKLVKEIEFNLHFRKHDNDSEDWKLVNDANGPIWATIASGTSDLLGYIGFTDDDVYYQHSNLRQSFIRLSFYDSPNRSNQSLLFYSTIFVDTNILYGKYMKFVSNGIEKGNGYVNYAGAKMADKRLDISFHCYDKFNMSGCSEGFYLYLFSTAVQGTLPTTIYMKVEFNHAKYGVTIPFIMPTDSKNEPIPYDSPDFPMSYTTISGDSENYGMETDMARVMQDSYVKILVKYDDKTKQHVWMLPRVMPDCNGKIIFDLFEPRVNAD